MNIFICGQLFHYIKIMRTRRPRANGEIFSHSDPFDTESEMPSRAPVLGPSSRPETPADTGIRSRVIGERGMFLPRVRETAWNNAAVRSRVFWNAATRPGHLVIPTGNDPAAAVDGAASYQLPG